MLEYIKIIILAILQGVAEFLPISSSGHLLVVGNFLQLDDNLFINILLHGGTLLSIIVFYRKLLLDLIIKFEKKMILQIIFGSIPIFVLGFVLKITALSEKIWSNSLIAGCGFLFSAVLIFWANNKFEKRLKKIDESEFIKLEELSNKQAFYIGLMQAIAIFPGVSRSGSTISLGLSLYLKREDCAKFSFLLAIPAIAGAVAASFLDMLKGGNLQLNFNALGLYGVGFFVSFVVGYFSLKFLLKVLQRGKFQYFSYYLFFVGTATLVYSIIKLLNG